MRNHLTTPLFDTERFTRLAVVGGDVSTTEAHGA
jgi:hypothetical protein